MSARANRVSQSIFFFGLKGTKRGRDKTEKREFQDEEPARSRKKRNGEICGQFGALYFCTLYTYTHTRNSIICIMMQ